MRFEANLAWFDLKDENVHLARSCANSPRNSGNTITAEVWI